MGKTHPSAKHDKPDGEAVNKSKTDCMVIDWDEVAELSRCNICEEIPDNAITIEKICKQFDIQASAAGTKLKTLFASGLYEQHFAKQGAHKIKYLIRTSNKSPKKG